MADEKSTRRSGPVSAKPCPICGRPSVPESRPFCSPRCRQIDLHHWLTGRYAIPVVEEDGGDDGDG
jgi:endogenous inhibitor of DNA gyrase (YacG/DUF329 family)